MRTNKKKRFLSMAVVVFLLTNTFLSGTAFAAETTESNTAIQEDDVKDDVTLPDLPETENRDKEETPSDEKQDVVPEEEENSEPEPDLSPPAENTSQEKEDTKVKKTDKTAPEKAPEPSIKPAGGDTDNFVTLFKLEPAVNNALIFRSGESRTFTVTLETNGESNGVINTPVLTLKIPKKYVSSDFSAPDISLQLSKTITSDADNYIIQYNLPSLSGGQSLQIPIVFTTMNGIIPKDGTIPITATLKDSRTSEVYTANEGDALIFTANVLAPSLQKTLSSSPSNGRIIVGGDADALYPDKLSSDPDELNYLSFSYTLPSTYYTALGARYFEKLVIIDTLPDDALFVPEANPAWTYDAATRTVTTTITSTNGRISGSAATLRLKFPGAEIGKLYTNKMDFELFPMNKEPGETTYTSADNITFYLKANEPVVPVPPSVNFRKYASTLIDGNGTSRGTALHNLEMVRNWSQYWQLYISNPLDDTDLGDITIRDFNLDDRLVYEKIHIPANSSLKGYIDIYATVGSSKTLIGSVDPSSFGDTIDIPADATEIILEARSGTILEKSSYFYAYIYTKFKNPETDPLTEGGRYLYNYTTLTYTETATSTADSRSGYAYFYISDYAPLQYLSKTVSTSKDYVAGNTVNYTLRYYTNGLAYGDTIKYDKVIDLIPPGFEYVPESTGNGRTAEPEIIDNYKDTGKTALIWSPGTESQTSGQNFYIYYTLRVTSTATGGINTNDVYLLWEDSDTIKPATSNSTADIYDFNDNGDTEELISKASSSINYVPAREVITKKSVKGSLDDVFLTSPAAGTSDPETPVQYELSIFNNSLVQVTELTIVDQLPFIGDKTSSPNLDGNYTERGSDFAVKLTGPVILPEGRENDFNVYYTDAALGGNPSDYVEDGSWRSSVSDYSSVTAVKIVMKEGLTLPKEETLNFYLNCITPDVGLAPEGSSASNSFAASVSMAQAGFFESNTVTYGIAEQEVGVLELLLRDRISKEPIPGGTYDLIDENEQVMGEYTTDENGKIRVKNLEPGMFYFVEKDIPAPYQLDDSPVEGEVFAGEITSVLVEKEIFYGNLEITALDENTKEVIPGAVYEVRVENGDVIGKYTTGKDGKILVTSLLPGDYVVTEKSVPNDYITKDLVESVVVVESETAQVVFEYGKPQDSSTPQTPDDVDESEESGTGGKNTVQTRTGTTPGTGDVNGMMTYWILMVLAGCVVLCSVWRKRGSIGSF